MKKMTLIVFLCVTVLSTSSCDWFKARMGMPTSQELALAREKALRDSIQQADYARLLAAEQARIQDSVAKDEAVEETPQQPSQRYHVIFGSFYEQALATRLMQQMTAAGMTPTLLNFKSGFKVVSAASYNSLPEANKNMDRFLMETELAPYDIWIYDTHLRLHME